MHVDENINRKRSISHDTMQRQNKRRRLASNSGDKDVSVIAAIDNSENFTFMPTQAKWRAYHSQRLALSKPSRLKKRTAGLLGVPTESENVEGDGNCYFRCLSRELGGTENNHEKLRDAVVSFMAQPENQTAFNNYTGQRTIVIFI